MSGKAKSSFAAQVLAHHAKFSSSKDDKPFAFTFDAECEKGKVVLIDGKSKFQTNLSANFKGKGKCIFNSFNIRRNKESKIHSRWSRKKFPYSGHNIQSDRCKFD